ncbi:MAG: hypothetical protein ACRDQW_16840 [Haloechinothrix sp.]
MLIRRELPADTETLRSLFATVYSDTFYDKLHADPAWLPLMSFIALDDDGEVW